MAPRKAASKQTSAPDLASTSMGTSFKAAKEKAHGYEFGGPLGAFVLSFGLPIVCYAFAFICNDVSGCPAPSLTRPYSLFNADHMSLPFQFGSEHKSGWSHALEVLKRETGWPGLSGLISLEAFAGTLAWYLLSLALYVVLPAQEVEGAELRGGGRLKYRFNSFSSGLVTLFMLAAGTWVLGPQFPVWTFIHRNYVRILTSNLIIAYSLATYTYIHSFSVNAKNPKDGAKQAYRQLAQGGHSGNFIYDWFIGRELNPRVTIPYLNTEVDIKAFMELRPGMLGWLVLDLAYMAKQYGSYGYVTDSIIIVTLMQGMYVLDALLNESAILTTIDITADGFGVMLSFGDLVWVPFTYTLQARYLSVHPVMLGPWLSLAIMVLGVGGYAVFRLANGEKNAFRTYPEDPSVQHLKYIQTATKSRLLVSGWWGRARHINYLGDWMLSWSYCLPTLLAGYRITPSILYPGTRLVTHDDMAGYAIPITYFYMLYFAVLLVHRAMRDDWKCRRKYGRDWEEYCRLVPSRIIPGIY